MAMTTVKLYGAMGARFGRVHHLDIETPAEAIRALSVIREGFERYLMTSRKAGLSFGVFRGKRNITLDEMRMPCGGEDVRIAPIITASKKGGLFQTILGAAMIVAGIALGPAGFGVVGATMAAGITLGGVSMMAGGVIQMLTPQPKGLAMAQDADNKPSYAFGGPINSTAAGGIVGVLYGRREVGGNIISAGIAVNEVRT